MQHTHEDTPRSVGMIALARNPLRLAHMDIGDGIPRAAAVTAPQHSALISALRWLIRQLRQVFLTAGAPTSVPRAGAPDEPAAERRAPRPGGSMLRRME